MRVIYLFLLVISFLNFALGQTKFEHRCLDGISRLGPIAEPKKFDYVKYNGGGYYKITSETATAYVECGNKIKISKDEVVNLSGDIYQGSYDGHTGQWAEVYIDFDGSGPESATRVYVLINALEKVLDKPKDTFQNKIRLGLVKEEIIGFSKILIFVISLIGLVILAMITRYQLWQRAVRQNKIANYTPAKPSLKWSIMFIALPIAICVWMYWMIEYNFPPSWTIAIFISSLGGCLFVIVESIFRKKPEISTKTCPNCKTIFIRKDILTKEQITGSVSYSSNETSHGTVYNNSGQSVGSFSQQIPVTRSRATYKFFFTCKSCGYDWTEEPDKAYVQS